MSASVVRNIKSAVIRLPHPWLTEYHVVPAGKDSYQLLLSSPQPTTPRGGVAPPVELHNPALKFSAPVALSTLPPDNDNSAWARARHAKAVSITWTTASAPTVGQLWLLIYTLFSLYHAQEAFRFTLRGPQSEQLRLELEAVGLAVPHPPSPTATHPDELVIPRDAFWQGAGSPFGPRPVWLADPSQASQLRINPHDYPAFPQTYTKTVTPKVHKRHPVRPPKPAPGSVIYSRYIPHLNEHFSMVAVDYTNAEHLNLFHKWQNDPRVSAGWHEEGDLEHHRRYLKAQHDDPHQIAVLARWDDEFWGYFELYWAREDHLGTEYDAGNYDRGRHALVGELRFRGPHRVRAWWSSMLHWGFLEDPRTDRVVGEPRATGKRVIQIDAEHGLSVEKWVDLGHKRSALSMIGREKFFQMCPMHWGDEEGLESAGREQAAKPGQAKL